MRTSIEITAPGPQAGTGDAVFTLSGFLSASASDASCFCCGSPTILILDAGGVLLLLCPECGAEISADETIYGAMSEPVLQAA